MRAQSVYFRFVEGDFLSYGIENENSIRLWNQVGHIVMYIAFVFFLLTNAMAMASFVHPVLIRLVYGGTMDFSSSTLWWKCVSYSKTSTTKNLNNVCCF